MREMRPIVLLTSAAALMLALGQGVRAELIASDAAAEAPAGEAAAPAAPTESAPEAASAEAAPAAAPVPEAASTVAAPAETSAPAEAPAVAEPAGEAATAAQPPAVPSPADAARNRMEQREAEMMGQRRLRYDELRTRAAEVGLDLPEIPPWEQAGVPPMEMPTPPEMPQPPGMTPPAGPEASSGMGPEGMDAMREQRYEAMRERAKQRGVDLPETPPWKLMTQDERKAHWEMMRNMTPEQRQAMREAHWQEMRERAKAQGIEMPELPPWKQAEQRRQEMEAQWEKYRSLVDQMSDEQREAAEAVFGQAARQIPPRPMPPRMPMQAPYGADYGMPRGPMMPGYGGRQGAGPGMSDWGVGDPWSGGDQGMYQAPPYPEAGYNQPW